MTTFETIADVFAARTAGLSTGLPQLDRVAPLGPGHLAVLIGASAVGKSRVASHITGTVSCTNEHGVLTVSTPTTIDALDSSLAFRVPALAVIDPLTSLLGPEDHVATAGRPASARPAEQRPVDPPELGRLADLLCALARRHRLPILACHRYTPIRDSVTGHIVSTEAANPLLDRAHFVATVRVLADPNQVGLEILRNRLGPTTTLSLPLPVIRDDQPASSVPFVPAPRMPLAGS